ncbi:hypothetical protein EDC04DRAFT_2745582 [Pisolithus marmoratus]|nr:hypothetical protein EDC04DRAFT_2745582 [Pisolithus marmoratus]
MENGIGAIDRVVLSQQYHITNWLLPTLNELARRPEPITLEEAKRMGIERATVIAPNNCCYCGCHQPNDNDVVVSSCRDPRIQNGDFSDQIRSTFSTFDL